MEFWKILLVSCIHYFRYNIVFVVTEQAGDKPAALKLVLKVGAPYTPSDVTSADSQSEAVDSDSERMSRSVKRKNLYDRSDHQEKKVL